MHSEQLVLLSAHTASVYEQPIVLLPVAFPQAWLVSLLYQGVYLCN